MFSLNLNFLGVKGLDIEITLTANVLQTNMSIQSSLKKTNIIEEKEI